jgi:hypothetical protein
VVLVPLLCLSRHFARRGERPAVDSAFLLLLLLLITCLIRVGDLVVLVAATFVVEIAVTSW